MARFGRAPSLYYFADRGAATSRLTSLVIGNTGRVAYITPGKEDARMCSLRGALGRRDVTYLKQ